MTYRGHIENGVVVLDDAAKLADGTTVVVRPVRKRDDHPRPGSPAAIREWLMSGAGWHGEPGEMERIYKEMQAEKWAQVQEQMNEEEQSERLDDPPPS